MDAKTRNQYINSAAIQSLHEEISPRFQSILDAISLINGPRSNPVDLTTCGKQPNQNINDAGLYLIGLRKCIKILQEMRSRLHEIDLDIHAARLTSCSLRSRNNFTSKKSSHRCFCLNEILGAIRMAVGANIHFNN